MIRNAAVLKLSDHQLINSEPHCYFFKFLWKSVMTCWQYTVWLWSHKRLYFESFEKKEEKLDSLCSTHPDKYLSYHQITFCGSFSGSTDFGGFLCEMIKKAHFFKRKQVSNKIAGNCVSPATVSPLLLPLGNVADFNICKFIFLRLYLPDHHLSRHCQLLICVLKASVRVLSIFFLNIFMIKFTGRTDSTHYIHVCHLRQMSNYPKQIEDLCIDSK